MFPTPLVRAFTLIEIMVVVVLLSLIVFALMAVFNTTQTAFRASMTQSDVLAGGRAAMDLMVQDLKEMSPSFGVTNGAVNFAVIPTNTTLIQTLVGSNQRRTNILEKFFVLSRENQTWTGVGYVVDTSSVNPINPLYRFSMSTNINAAPGFLFNNFLNASVTNTSLMSHLIDGVIELRVRAFDNNGSWMTNGYLFGQPVTVKNVLFLPAISGENEFYMFSNSLPASVEIEMATLEDRTLQRAESLPFQAQTNYLAQQAGKVHVFRQRVSIPNVDPSAYQ